MNFNSQDVRQLGQQYCIPSTNRSNRVHYIVMDDRTKPVILPNYICLVPNASETAISYRHRALRLCYRQKL